RERNAYVDYLNEIGFIKDVEAGVAAVVDIGYSGSMQYYLKKILNVSSIPGYYFLTHLHAKEYFKGDVYKGYLADIDDHKNGFRHKLNDHVFIFESALSSPEGSLLCFEGIGGNRKMNLLNAEEEKKRVYLLNDIHAGARAFFKDINEKFYKNGAVDVIPSVLAASFITRFAESPKPKDAEMFMNFQVENVFGGGSVNLIADYSKLGIKKNHIIPSDIKNYLISESKWKQGAKVFFDSFGSDSTQAKEHKVDNRLFS
ncbi:hypothetical protein ACPF4F_003684, partial [Vibrio cholerae]